MKNNLLFLSIVFIIGACSTQKTISKSEKADKKIEIAANDSIEYRLVSFDPGFDTWFLRYKNKGDMRTMSYYQHWNQRYVNDWNARVNSSYGHRYFNSSLFIYPNEIDDFEIQHQLFYYFQYVENELKIKILYGISPRVLY